MLVAESETDADIFINPFPFSDQKYDYWSDAHRLAAEQLDFAIGGTAPLTLLTGEAGTGKSTVMRRVVQEVQSHRLIGTLPQQRALEEIQPIAIFRALGAQIARDEEDIPLETLVESIRLAKTRLGYPTLVVDDADMYPDERLAELIKISRIEHEDILFKLLLVGQPELAQRIKSDWPQLVGPSIELEPMSEEDISGYIHHRLAVAQHSVFPFTEAALERISSFSGGNPLKINLVCMTAIDEAQARGLEHIDAELAELCCKSPGAPVGDVTQVAPSALEPTRPSEDEEKEDAAPEEPKPVLQASDGVTSAPDEESRSAEAAADTDTDTDTDKNAVTVADKNAGLDENKAPVKEAATASPEAAPDVPSPAESPTERPETPEEAQAVPTAEQPPAQDTPALGETEGAPAQTSDPRPAQSEETASADKTPVSDTGAEPAPSEPAPATPSQPALEISPNEDEPENLFRPSKESPSQATLAQQNPLNVKTPSLRSATGLSDAQEGPPEDKTVPRPAAEAAAEKPKDPPEIRKADAPETPDAPTPTPAPATATAPAPAPAPESQPIDPRPKRPHRAFWLVAAGAAVGLAYAVGTDRLQIPSPASLTPWVDRPAQSGSQETVNDTSAGAPDAISEATSAKLAALGAALVTLPTDPQARFDYALDVSIDEPETAAVVYALAGLDAHSRAAYYLGQMYEVGEGVGPNLGLARVWYGVASDEIDAAGARVAAIAEEPPSAEVAAPIPLYAAVTESGAVEFVWTPGGSGTVAFAVTFADAEGNELMRVADLSRNAIRILPPETATHWRSEAIGQAGSDGTFAPWLPLPSSAPEAAE